MSTWTSWSFCYASMSTWNQDRIIKLCNKEFYVDLEPRVVFLFSYFHESMSTWNHNGIIQLIIICGLGTTIRLSNYEIIISMSAWDLMVISL